MRKNSKILKFKFLNFLKKSKKRKSEISEFLSLL